jgi:WD40 repeat protein/nucleoside phosphorylase
VGHAGYVNACAVTPDGKRVVSGSHDTTLKVWDLTSGNEVATLRGHAGIVSACVVMADGRRVVSGSSDKTVKVWDLTSGNEVATLQGHAKWVRACAATPDGRCVVSGSDDHTLKVWDLATGHEVATLHGHLGGVLACAVTPDGRRVVSGSDDQTLKVWDLATGHEVATLHGHAGRILACAVTPDGHVVSGSDDQTLKVWDLATDEQVATLRVHAFGVHACAVTPDGRRVVLGLEDHTLEVWDLATGDEVGTLHGHAASVFACAVTPDGRRVVSGSVDGTLKVWDLATLNKVASLHGHTRWVTACGVTVNGRCAVSGSVDRTLKVWDLAGNEVATLHGHADWVRGCALTPDGRHVVSGSDDQTLKVWDLATAREIATLHGHLRGVLACTLTPDGRRVVSGSVDRTLKVWDLATEREVTTLHGHTDWVLACAVTPDGQHVVSGSHDKTLRVWDLASGREVAILHGHAGSVLACAVTSDGHRVVSGSDDSTLKVWDLATGRDVATLYGHAGGVTACVVTSDGRVVSGSHDKTLKVWDLESGRCLVTHHASAAFAAVAATGATIVAGDAAGAVWFLDWPSSTRRAAPKCDESIRTSSATIARDAEPTSPKPPMKKHTILFLAANPAGTSEFALGREARAIQVELERAGFRDSFELVTRWAAEPLDLLRQLRKLKPTVVHFSGRGRAHPAGPSRANEEPTARDPVAALAPLDSEAAYGLFFQGPNGQPQLVSTDALQETFGAAGSSVKLVVLNACYSETQAAALLAHVDCVVGMRGSISDAAARSFAIGFYGGVGERESVAAAYQQGCAAISLEGQADSSRPQLQVRSGVDAARLVLATASEKSRGEDGATPSPAVRSAAPEKASAMPSQVDIGILTIRDDEFRAVLAVFPDKVGTHKGKSREYTLRYADAGNGKRYRIAIVRQVAQGTGEAQDAARDLIDDLAPRLVLVVGIAGAPPSDDVKLGDVVVSTRIYDFAVEARKAGEAPTYAVTGGPVDKVIEGVVANLAAREDELGSWTPDLPVAPPVTWANEGDLVGPPEWQDKLLGKLEHHYGAAASPRPPIYATGPIASSDRLVHDPELLIPWLQTARSMLAIEMEAAGVYRAARERCPMLAIRGISDIVGLKRADAWTKYACASAAAFTRAFLRTLPVGDPS